MTKLRLIITIVFFWLLPTFALASLNIVASSSSTGFLIREIAKEHANLTILAPPDRNLHHINARPSMIRALRGADLLVTLGSDLEIGWIPLAISQSTNPNIQVGKDGYFEATAQVNLLDVGGSADRSLGDVHPTGNPHINMDPIRMAEVAIALAERLAVLDRENAITYLARAKAFVEKTNEQIKAWRQQISNEIGVITFHRDIIYLLDRLGIPLLGTLEPVPGVPPTASHIHTLVNKLSGKSGIVLSTTYQPKQAPSSIAKALGWKQVKLPLEPPIDADGNGYLKHMQRWIDAISINE